MVIVVGAIWPHGQIRGVPSVSAGDRRQGPADTCIIQPGEGTCGVVPADLNKVPVIQVLFLGAVQRGVDLVAAGDAGRLGFVSELTYGSHVLQMGSPAVDIIGPCCDTIYLVGRA